jgi:hypothetical protein
MEKVCAGFFAFFTRGEGGEGQQSQIINFSSLKQAKKL